MFLPHGLIEYIGWKFGNQLRHRIISVYAYTYEMKCSPKKDSSLIGR